jgi:hypothetical protein
VIGEHRRRFPQIIFVHADCSRFFLDRRRIDFLLEIDVGQVARARGDVRVLRFENLFSNLEGALEIFQRFVVLAFLH